MILPVKSSTNVHQFSLGNTMTGNWDSINVLDKKAELINVPFGPVGGTNKNLTKCQMFNK